jgi:hypothetical protein
MNRDHPKAPHPDRSRRDMTGEQQVASAEVEGAIAPPDVQPAAAPRPSSLPSEDDQVEAGFDNMPV